MKLAHTVLSWLALVLAASAIDASDVVVVPDSSTGAANQHTILLAIDDRSLPLRDNVCLYLSKPTLREEAVLKPQRDNLNAPDYLGAFFYGTVIHDGDKYRMWYYGAHPSGGRWKMASQPCYAESADGLEWKRPVLGQVEFKGSKENNVIGLVSNDTQGVTVIKDANDPDPARRYKMVMQYMPKDYPTLKTAVSADGLHWTDVGDLPHRQFREQSSFFKHDGLYIVCGHTPSTGESGSLRGRQGFAWVSPDFKTWPIAEAESFILPEPAPTQKDKWKQQFDQVHLGVGATSFGNVAVGLIGRWHEHGWSVGGTTCDLDLVISNDGIHFREPVAGHTFLDAADAPLPTENEKKYPTILTQANGILNVGDETRIYYGRWRNTEWPLKGDGLHYYSDIALATLPRDRWGSIGLVPGATEGAVWSAPFRVPAGGCEVALNAEGADGMRVEIADANFQPIPTFSADQAGACKQDSGLTNPVVWLKGKLKDLAGKTVRLRLTLTKKTVDPKLFAINLSSESNTDFKVE